MSSYLKPMLLASAMIFGATFANAETTLKLAHAAPESDLQQTMSVFLRNKSKYGLTAMY
jgi:DNA-binding PucR family transcriptional regulator